MKSHKLALALAAFVLSGAMTVGQAYAMPMSPDQMKMMDHCKSMSSDGMMHDKDCMGMMKMMHVTHKDMMSMNTCKGMDHDTMMADKSCMMEMRKHPEMMK